MRLSSRTHPSGNRGHSPGRNATQLHSLFQPLILASWSVYFYRGEREREGGQEGKGSVSVCPQGAIFGQ